MLSRRQALSLIVPALTTVAMPAFARTRKGTPFDTDNDGTVDLAEAKKAAGDLFDKLDTDKDGTLDRKELHGRLSGRDFAGADPDNDKTLSKDEYLAVVEKRFKAADPDNDGTVSTRELRTAPGRALAKLLR
jgi:Ca2+-binding EF-hand superfamily protein